MKIGEAPLSELRRLLASEGVGLRLGPYQFRIESSMEPIVRAVHTLHAHHPLRPADEFSDFRLRLEPGWARLRPTVVASVNDQVWHIWPRRLTVAAMEWVCSWCYFRGAYRSLAVHAAVAALPETEDAIVFPADSGSGKSTLASTLMLSGWDLLSDEIALFDLDDQRLTALARPTILKGYSLELLAKRFSDRAVFGPRGRILDPPQPIAHMQPTEASVRINGKKYRPTAFVFPSREPGVSLQLEPLTAGQAFAMVSQFGINYRTHGEAGFHAVLELARSCPAFRLHYEDAGEAEAFLRKNQHRFLAARDERGAGRSGEAEILTVVGNCSTEKSLSLTPKNQQARDVTASEQRDVSRSSSLDLAASARHSLLVDHNSRDPLLSTLIEGLRNPDCLRTLELSEWDRLVPLAVHLELLPQIARRVSERPWWSSLSTRVRQRLSQEIQASDFNETCIRFELRQLQRILSPVCDRLVLLKGAAYMQAGFVWAAGRRTSDVDLLVPESSLPEIESALADEGYRKNDDLSAKDDRYYRRWLHEIPPMQHEHRRVEVDVHFRLLPLADPLSFSVAEEIARSVPLPGTSFRILDRVDRVLHAILNLARTGEFRRAIRDLWDLRCMIHMATDFDSAGPRHDFFDWDEFLARVEARCLQRSAADILLLMDEVLGPELPAAVLRQLADGDPSRHRRRRLYRVMRMAAVPCTLKLRSRRRRLALWGMEHYPVPRIGTWLDPLTWTKRLQFLRD